LYCIILYYLTTLAVCIRCVLPWMVRRSFRGALWWLTDSYSATFVFRISEVSWNPRTKKTDGVNYSVENTHLPIM